VLVGPRNGTGRLVKDTSTYRRIKKKTGIIREEPEKNNEENLGKTKQGRCEKMGGVVQRYVQGKGVNGTRKHAGRPS